MHKKQVTKPFLAWLLVGGRGRIRTTEVVDGRFTVRILGVFGYLVAQCEQPIFQKSLPHLATTRH